jgi:predicted AAA+ superfamily ATPase
MLKRGFHLKMLHKRLRSAGIVAILGPRQCGKTTLAQVFNSDLHFDLENPADLAALENPVQALKNSKRMIVIDEIQRCPELFPYLRHFVDSHKNVKILLLGSSSRDLIRQSSESLAGRISYYQLCGFSCDEVDTDQVDRLWLRGGFPKSFLAKTETTSWQWREDYTRTFLEQDIPQLGIQIPSPTLRRFWVMLAHYGGQVLNYSEIGKNFGASDTTIKKYLDILAGTFMVEILAPYHANISKRQVKSPKFYFRDTGVFHYLLQIRTRKDLLSHPKVGASWETLVLQTIRSRYSGELYFWNTHAHAEIDFVIPSGRSLIGFEAKFSDAPRITPSMKIAIQDLDLQKIFVVYPGEKRYSLAEKIEVIPLHEIFSKLPL